MNKAKRKELCTYKLQTHAYKRCFVMSTTFVSFEVVRVITFARNDLEVSLSTTKRRRRRRRVGTRQDEQGMFINNQKEEEKMSRNKAR
jgi:hypothetical protein